MLGVFKKRSFNTLVPIPPLIYKLASFIIYCSSKYFFDPVGVHIAPKKGILTCPICECPLNP